MQRMMKLCPQRGFRQVSERVLYENIEFISVKAGVGDIFFGI
jgi:hypothetical protein